MCARRCFSSFLRSNRRIAETVVTHSSALAADACTTGVSAARPVNTAVGATAFAAVPFGAAAFASRPRPKRVPNAVWRIGAVMYSTCNETAWVGRGTVDSAL
jgi:hypothetical protein